MLTHLFLPGHKSGLEFVQIQVFEVLPTLSTGPPRGQMVSHMAKMEIEIGMKYLDIDKFDNPKYAEHE